MSQATWREEIPPWQVTAMCDVGTEEKRHKTHLWVTENFLKYLWNVWCRTYKYDASRKVGLLTLPHFGETAHPYTTHIYSYTAAVLQHYWGQWYRISVSHPYLRCKPYTHHNTNVSRPMVVRSTAHIHFVTDISKDYLLSRISVASTFSAAAISRVSRRAASVTLSCCAPVRSIVRFALFYNFHFRFFRIFVAFRKLLASVHHATYVSFN